MNGENPLKNLIHGIIKDVAFGLHEKIALRTPIDTGRATSSWNLSEDAPDESLTPALQEVRSRYTGAVLESKAEGASRISKEQAMTVAMGTRQNISETPSVVFISNALPYIEGLEHGASKTQAPKGFVAVTATEDEVQLLIGESISRRDV